MEKSSSTDFDVVIVGAGISGINAAYRVQSELPEGTTYAILEARDAIGGTWDLFRYPGIRSDSDLHTFGFSWRPWSEQRSIADGASIQKYMQETAAIHGIDQHIKFQHKLRAANWSSDVQRWQLSLEANGEKKIFNSRFLIMGTGYYDYQEPLPAVIPGLENFKGTIVHPQFWPEDLDYAGKNMVIIGSGATAVTLLPNLAEKAKHVTMLQRSPSYILSRPLISPLNDALHVLFPDWIAFKLIRWRHLIMAWLFYLFCQTFPIKARDIIRKRTVEQLPKNIPHDPHFEPAYSPWDQRLCVCPDGDFYKVLRDGKADIATGSIKNVTESSIELETGQTLNTDVIITATGLKVQFAGGVTLSVDGEAIKPSDKFFWKGVMLQDVPNAVFVLGYANASWTLGADATARLATRLINTMRSGGMSACVPRLQDPETLGRLPLLNLSSTYMKRAENDLPRAGDRGQWRPRRNYISDIWQARFGDIKTGLQMYRVST
ncbi:uncharacterized protein K452DRAFT_288952 [Aplosporella prunicola CBS 121167]|uniref:FAD/NAD(P)-binding domain-containing protein n=1 Tax=Aplosporella prunicola CBS 121167 TaxID=1176127 RepID=A0A6A6BA55_9PEZI|nr:uncharacterized protein K452DRAFT_288952 [Aplosporella prunicola CBS 121167]KAF2140185.1 hypothetical protein K452DRAFT_288952 [Aplosporella prunicola CBS 121167]